MKRYQFAVTSCGLSVQLCHKNEAVRACYSYLLKPVSTLVSDGMEMTRTLQENNCLINIMCFCMKSTTQSCTFNYNNQSLSFTV